MRRRMPLISLLTFLLSTYCIDVNSSFQYPVNLNPRVAYITALRVSNAFNTPINDDISNPSTSTNANTNEYSFYDEATIYVRAGSGGQGASTYTRVNNSSQKGKPNGGQGGKGGDVILQAVESFNTLAHLNYLAYRPNAFGGSGAAAAGGGRSKDWIHTFRAENGADGKSGFKNGKWAEDIVVYVPSGTIIEEEIEFEDKSTGGRRTKFVPMGEVAVNPTEHSSNARRSIVVARGGEGGDGSSGSASTAGGGSSSGSVRGLKQRRMPPQGGERKRLKLTLKIVGDVAIVGVPNAGKSTLLAAVTRAKPKIANYPFTTVIPNLGVWVPHVAQQPSNGDSSSMAASLPEFSKSLVLCDVPGLISGAAEGVGLGHAFLRHVERCHVILHIVDATSDDPLRDFEIINQELTRYGNGALVDKPQVVVVNKVDAWETDEGDVTLSRQELEQGLRNAMPHSRLMFMSASEKDGVEDLMQRLASFVDKVKASNAASTKVTVR